MGSRAESKRARLEATLRARTPGVIDEVLADELKLLVAPVSDSYLREVLRGSGIPLTPLVEGVVTASFEELERTLLALSSEYRDSAHALRTRIRAMVIDAKNRLRWAEKRAPDGQQRSTKEEMLLWTLTWLENPEAFEVWISLRKRELAKRRSQHSE